MGGPPGSLESEQDPATPQCSLRPADWDRVTQFVVTCHSSPRKLTGSMLIIFYCNKLLQTQKLKMIMWLISLLGAGTQAQWHPFRGSAGPGPASRGAAPHARGLIEGSSELPASTGSQEHQGTGQRASWDRLCWTG